MDNLKRFTICKLAGHEWLTVSYPAGRGGERAGRFLRCKRCGKEDHDAGSVAPGPGNAIVGA